VTRTEVFTQMLTLKTIETAVKDGQDTKAALCPMK
jgi:hypothetical protein